MVKRRLNILSITVLFGVVIGYLTIKKTWKLYNQYVSLSQNLQSAQSSPAALNQNGLTRNFKRAQLNQILLQTISDSNREIEVISFDEEAIENVGKNNIVIIKIGTKGQFRDLLYLANRLELLHKTKNYNIWLSSLNFFKQNKYGQESDKIYGEFYIKSSYN